MATGKIVNTVREIMMSARPAVQGKGAEKPTDTLFASGEVAEDFAFTERVAEVFDDMLSRSIPHYRTVIDGMAQLLAELLPDRATVYDLGCSTGTTLLELSRCLVAKQFRYIGIDNAQAMLEKARNKSAMFSKSNQLTFQQGDITTCPMPDVAGIVCNYTMQFLRPVTRQAFVRRLYAGLPQGGVLLLSEKSIAHSSLLNRAFIGIYHDFKRQQGYSELEIAAKREALENVLVPFSLEENIAMLRQAGFGEIEVFFKWFNFSSLVAIKKDGYEPG